jgi:hypothetical protein
MATDLTPELRAALAAAGGDPLELVDPLTNEHFVVLRKSYFEQLVSFVKVMDDAWDDPDLDVYNELDPRRVS